MTADDGLTASTILHQRSDISILFSDVVMPGSTNGIELARLARKRVPGITVILASGYPLPALKATHGNLDDFAVMNKPYRLADLANKLRTAR